VNKNDLGYKVVKKLASQLFSAVCEARKFSKVQSTRIRHAISVSENDLESFCTASI